jgi:hypothetical protein
MVWVTLLTAVAGIVSTLLAYFLAPQRRKDKIRQQLVDVYQQLDKFMGEADEAMQNHNNDMLTIATDNIIRLRKVKADLLQQLSKS